MDELVFDIDKKAIEHYRYRLLETINKKENKEIKPILEKQLKKILELLDEIFKCYDEYNEKQRKLQWDRYGYVTCKAVLMYKEDLVRTKEIMSGFGTEKIKLNTREIENNLERIENRISTFHNMIEELEKYPHLSSF